MRTRIAPLVATEAVTADSSTMPAPILLEKPSETTGNHAAQAKAGHLRRTAASTSVIGWSGSRTSDSCSAYPADIQQLLIPLTGTPIQHSGPRRRRCPGRCHPQDLQVDVLTERHPVANAAEGVWHRVAQPSQSRRQIACVEPAVRDLLPTAPDRASRCVVDVSAACGGTNVDGQHKRIDGLAELHSASSCGHVLSR